MVFQVLAPPQEMFGGGGNRNIVTLDFDQGDLIRLHQHAFYGSRRD
jgi:hypothetical protein